MLYDSDIGRYGALRAVTAYNSLTNNSKVYNTGTYTAESQLCDVRYRYHKYSRYD